MGVSYFILENYLYVGSGFFLVELLDHVVYVKLFCRNFLLNLVIGYKKIDHTLASKSMVGMYNKDGPRVLIFSDPWMQSYIVRVKNVCWIYLDLIKLGIFIYPRLGFFLRVHCKLLDFEITGHAGSMINADQCQIKFVALTPMPINKYHILDQCPIFDLALISIDTACPEITMITKTKTQELREHKWMDILMYWVIHVQPCIISPYYMQLIKMGKCNALRNYNTRIIYIGRGRKSAYAINILVPWWQIFH